jgi:hypothetical protein
MQGSSENGTPSRAGGGAPQQLPTSPNTGTPARSQSGISHPCDQNVETTCAIHSTSSFQDSVLGRTSNHTLMIKIPPRSWSAAEPASVTW